MQEPNVTQELAAEHGLSAAEFAEICERMGRTPSYTELGIVSVMWSEHCSYKSSRAHLSKLPTEGPRVIEGPGENAGVVDIDDGQAVVFKMESHNHPSFIEPYQGAATGVGGICRDVFTMGARPIAIADCLRFGSPEHPRTHYLVSGVVAGIGGYGNSFGVPTVAGDVSFDESYNGNILVNAFCLGLARSDRIFRGYASGVGNPVLYVGAKTGRDGIHGATMASAEFGEDASAKRPAVQVGDPFMEKLLLEACLELMQGDCLVGIQDMGAAGLTSSAVEMASRAGSGIELDLEAVPVRERAMVPYELMLSESQERMLMVVSKGREAEALAVFEKWDLDAAVIGHVTDTGRVVVRMNGQVYADLPAELLTDGPTVERPMAKPRYLEDTGAFDVATLPDTADVAADLLALIGSPNLASKGWVIEQYDYMVRHGTVVRPGAADAGIVRVFAGDRSKGVAISAGCNSRWVYLDPYNGTKAAVAEAYANLVAVGAQPLAVTNCLNFGNPENPEILWKLAQSVRGLGDACSELATPVVSGNVSLYNETDGSAIKPTPMVGMVGLLSDVSFATSMAFARSGDRVAVIGKLGGRLGASEYLALVHGKTMGAVESLESRHHDVFAAVLDLVRERLLRSCHDISEGGLAVAIAEAAVMGGLGASCEIDAQGRLDELLFGEGLARFVVSIAPDNVDAVAARCRHVDFAVIGTVGGDVLELARGNERSSVPLARLQSAYQSGFRAVVE